MIKVSYKTAIHHFYHPNNIWHLISIPSLGFKYLTHPNKNISIRSQYQYLGYWTFIPMQYIAPNANIQTKHKGNGDVYHEPFKDTCIESDIVIDDYNKHAQTSESTTSYKHVNFCGVLRPCEQSHGKEYYCIHHINEETPNAG
jgi:hypothetical protein